MDMAMWASLLTTDLLLEIFRRLDASAVVRCACACKQWRRAITGNASSLHPRPDRFNPSHLLGFFQHYRHRERILDLRLRRAPGPFQSALPEAAWERLCSLMPAASANDIYIDRLSRYRSKIHGRSSNLPRSII